MLRQPSFHGRIIVVLLIGLLQKLFTDRELALAEW